MFAARSPAVRGLLWMAASGALYSVLNALLRSLSLRMSPYQTLGLVYGGTLVVMLPWILRGGAARFWPQAAAGLLVRGGVHWAGMCLWLLAVAHITLAETTAIGFTTPLFILVGATLLLKEQMHWERALATLAGFGGVLVIVWPRLTSAGNGADALLMLGAACVFAGSFLLSKRLTRVERPAVIVVWQSLIVTVCSIPLAVLHWQPQGAQTWITVLAAAMLMALGNYCVTRAFSEADISASQPAKFLDLVWACLLGWLMFSDRPQGSTLVGGLVILVATVWAAHRESVRARGR